MVKTEDKKYYIHRTGAPYIDKTIEEIDEELDIFILPTVMSVLKKLDYPFIIQEWLITIKKYNNNKLFKDTDFLTNYLAKMNLPSWKSFTYKDSIFFNELLKEFY